MAGSQGAGHHRHIGFAAEGRSFFAARHALFEFGKPVQHEVEMVMILRMGVGLGESALLPSTLSLLADYFPPKRLATPTSV
ncbi:MAG: hypothetical protein ACE10G_13310, partial [Gemmatimonadales bacterium]